MKMAGGTDMEVSFSMQQEELAISNLMEFVESSWKDDNDPKKREESIIELGSILARKKRTQELSRMIEMNRPFLLTLGKAKAARMVRDLVDLCLKIDQDGDIKIKLVEESILWATSQNQIFLRQALQSRLIRLYNDLERYTNALKSASQLIHELKKMDDKELLMEVLLEESRGCYYLSNMAKARTSLTSARTIANSMYVSPAMQAGLDMQSGILQAADERDFQTAFSYFYEAYEGFDFVDLHYKATMALKYMLLCKVMLDTPDAIAGILAHKNAEKYKDSNISAILAIANAAKNRSLKQFNEAFGHYRDELQCDHIVRKHFGTLSESMLEKELCRLIEPYSHVQIAHIAKVIQLPVNKVEKKLAQMILDKKFIGSLHQDGGMLMIYEDSIEDSTYDTAVKVVHAVGEVVDVLYKQAKTFFH